MRGIKVMMLLGWAGGGRGPKRNAREMADWKMEKG
jgi:hypothetical protein